MKKMTLWAGIALAGASAWALPTVSDVKAQQRYPWNGMVDIDYTITGDEGVANPGIAVKVTDQTTRKTYEATKFLEVPPTGPGRHRITWSMAAEGIDLISTNVVFSVSLLGYDRVAVTNDLFYVIDLSGGTAATHYPVTCLASVPKNGWTDEYKTTKLVLRRIPAGSFIMGEDQSDESHRVTLTKPFYIGVFEVTQKQWGLVMGSNPSWKRGDKRPVEYVSYNSIRGSSAGANWPSSSAVDATSFLGRLRARSGLEDFDLPTEAQWEYACRAGTTSAYNNGGDTEDDLRTLGRYSGNQSDGRGGYTGTHTEVGSYAPNAWGLYDMHGNAWEWCLDWRGTLDYGTDPVGSSSGSLRVTRGGCYGHDAGSCTSSGRGYYNPSRADSSSGFRLVRTLNNKME